MNIAVTGATGMIGSAFAALASGSGHEVIGCSRRPAQPGPVFSRWLSSDSRHPVPETRLDAIVHLAGESLLGLWTKTKRERIWNSRVELTQRLVSDLRQWQPANRPRVLLCASGVGFYGTRGDETLDETRTPGGGWLAELCQQWEAAAREAEKLGVRVVLLRSGMVLGRQAGAFPLMRRAFACGVAGRLGGGRQWLSWIHEQDEAGLMLWALENEAVAGPVNLCAPDPVTNADFTRRLAARLHRPALLHAPAFALRLLLRGMADEMLLASQRAFPRVATDLGYRFACPTLDDALTALL